ncbi:hypothetical protein T12_15156 [Trichinella patagoniensis]|uniref:Uncharacterized protein n=1 Tax=Trichinella patagoniensis TaxID=990121 RepID=A0A0V0ZKE5_9BILA|nr:hypothetical protein T12_15156 [Trichinella patagoniensis]
MNEITRVHILSAPFAEIDKSNQAAMSTSCDDSKFTSPTAASRAQSLADEIFGCNGLKQLVLVLAHLCDCNAFFSTHFAQFIFTNFLLCFDSGQKKFKKQTDTVIFLIICKAFSKTNAEEEHWGKRLFLEFLKRQFFEQDRMSASEVESHSILAL